VKQKQYYIFFENKYYNKCHGWVDHKRFADKLTHNEATALKQFYKTALIKL